MNTRKLLLLPLLSLLAVPAFTSSPPVIQVSGVCQLCAQTEDCFACCRCAGQSVGLCAEVCSS